MYFDLEVSCLVSLAVRKLLSRDVVAKKNDKDGGISVFKRFVLVRFSRFREWWRSLIQKLKQTPFIRGSTDA
jgi:hypothetical protein